MNSSYLLERQRVYDSCQKITNDNDFWDVVKDLYVFQKKYNPVFSQYLSKVVNEGRDNSMYFLPISTFKTHEIKTGKWAHQKIFTSSGTSGISRSKHYVKSLEDYLKNTKLIFEAQFGSLKKWCFLCLLPSYLEREGSSLIDMCSFFIDQSGHSQSGFYLYNHEDLNQAIIESEERSIPTILFGVSYALLDFSERYHYDSLNYIKIMKTGGMKGRREEMNTDELDKILKASFGIQMVMAEYGMTECQSQLYSINGNSYAQNDRMKVLITDLSDPFTFVDKGRTGRINIIDTANIDSCAFIASDDVGYITEDNELYILGRIDNSDLRGCNLLL